MSGDGSGSWLRRVLKRTPPPEQAPETPVVFATLFGQEIPAGLVEKIEAAPPGPAVMVTPPAPPPIATPIPADREPETLPGDQTVAYFRLRTSQGDTVCVAEGGARLTRGKLPDTAQSVIAMVPQSQPHACLLVLPDMRPFGVVADDYLGIALSARILRATRRGVVRLKYPLGGLRFLTVASDRPDEPIADLRFDGVGQTLAAAFAMVPVPAEEVPAALRRIGAELDAAAKGGFRQAIFIRALQSGALRPELAEPVLRLLPPDELADLARRLLDEPDLLGLLRRVMPGDRWIGEKLPALAAWRTSRPPVVPEGRTDSPASDEMLMAGPMNMRGVPVGAALVSLARRHVAPTRNCCVLASARNEGPYLLEWLAYHLSIGFEHVFLYTNDNQDGSDALLGLLARHGVITLVRNERGAATGVQEKAYAHALTCLPQILDFRWTAILDLDEYFAFDAEMFDGVADVIALQEAQAVDAVALSWLLFASGIGETYAETPTLERLTRRADYIDPHVKTLFRTRLFWHAQPHFPYPAMDLPFHYRVPDGVIHHHPGVLDRLPAFAARPAAELAWVNHYILRTASEALWKLSRGRADWLLGDDDSHKAWFTDFIAKTFLDLARPEHLVSDRRILACAGGQADMLATLLALPGVAASHAEIRANFARKLRALAENFLSATPPPDASPSLLRFRDAVSASQNPGMAAPVVVRAVRSHVV
jgi:hypothetical protein